MLGYERSELIGVHASEVMAEGEFERGQQHVQELLADEERESDVMDMDMRTKSGDQLTVSVHYSVLTADDGTYAGLMDVVCDITERKRRERELLEPLALASEFASVASHDLRSPLSVAKGRLELAREEYDSEDLDAASDALDRMEDLIDDVLELARKGRTVDDPQPVPLADVVGAARTSLPGTTSVRSDLERAVVHGDRTRLIEVFENLFTNTADYAGADSTISVGLLEDDRGFYVEDDGPGIQPEHRDSVFDHGYTTSSAGTGFGLSIAKRIVEAHGWEITATSAGTGGARFVISGVDSLDQGPR